jgi:hypothetical protein
MMREYFVDGQLSGSSADQSGAVAN